LVSFSLVLRQINSIRRWRRQPACAGEIAPAGVHRSTDMRLLRKNLAMKLTRISALTSTLLATVLSHSIAHSQTSASLGVQIASIDAGQRLMEEAPQVKRATLALRAASSRCTATAQLTADQVVVVVREVQRQGGVVSVVELLEGLDAVLVDFNSRADCLRVLASYAAIRKEGYTHSRAVVMQRALMKAIAESAPPKR
jgi:hypothetical protein